MRGQMFITGAALLIIILGMFSLSFVDVSRAADASRQRMDNIEQEFRYAIGISSSAGDKLSPFSTYLRDKVSGIEDVYMLADVGTSGYTVTVGNFLRNPITVTLNATNSNPSIQTAVISDTDKAVFPFTGSGNVELTLSYSIQSRVVREKISFAVQPQTIGFYDVALKNSDGLLRRKDVYVAEK